MYRKRDKAQLTMDEFYIPFGDGYKDSCERNTVESRNGIGKRRYGLDLIMAYFAETGKTEAAFIILAMNVAHLLRLLLSLFCHMLAGVGCAGKSLRTLQVAV